MSGSNRPRFHFTPTSGWINDPYGVTWHDGRYHLFFQHLPGQVSWAPEQHWGHAVSDDLLRWTEHEVVLSPDDIDGGIWSGSVVRTDSGDGRMFYTAVRVDHPQIGVVRAARPADPSWNVWHKEATVAAPPEGLRLAAFRDPYVLHDGHQWRMLVGAGTPDGTALALSWTSPDLDTWSYVGVLASRPSSSVDPVWTGTVWECPQLFQVGSAWVLVVSVWAEHQTRYEAYAVGDLVDGKFMPRAWRRLTYGPGHYAGSAFTDNDGRPCLLHWLRDVVDPERGWAGAHSVSHVLSLQGDRLLAEPHPVVAFAAEPLPPGTARRIGRANLQLDDDVLAVEIDSQRWTMPCRGGPVRLLVDGPVVEIFGPEGVAAFAVGPRTDPALSTGSPSVRAART
ncbi:glycoside hydrolase family 32 protein [Nocardioides gansuensis]|uniref:glycoside hydrolase family 32 protein n=1 Tax=Nocardioides gansuensis TaxID=2138300 RepID=UPI00140387B3|nr:glycoside hydrolase family 32 protein [Nocardioides gansuensis]